MRRFRHDQSCPGRHELRVTSHVVPIPTMQACKPARHPPSTDRAATHSCDHRWTHDQPPVMSPDNVYWVPAVTQLVNYERWADIVPSSAGLKSSDDNSIAESWESNEA